MPWLKIGEMRRQDAAETKKCFWRTCHVPPVFVTVMHTTEKIQDNAGRITYSSREGGKARLTHQDHIRLYWSTHHILSRGEAGVLYCPVLYHPWSLMSTTLCPSLQDTVLYRVYELRWCVARIVQYSTVYAVPVAVHDWRFSLLQAQFKSTVVCRSKKVYRSRCIGPHR